MHSYLTAFNAAGTWLEASVTDSHLEILSDLRARASADAKLGACRGWGSVTPLDTVTTATLETVIVILHTNILWETLAASLLELRGKGQDTAACGVILINLHFSVFSEAD